MKFKRKYNVQSHMPACVKRNGNPNGAHWTTLGMGKQCSKSSLTGQADYATISDQEDHDDAEESHTIPLFTTQLKL